MSYVSLPDSYQEPVNTTRSAGEKSDSGGVKYYNTGKDEGTLEYADCRSQPQSRVPDPHLGSPGVVTTHTNPAYNVSPGRRYGAINNRPLPVEPPGFPPYYTRYEDSPGNLYDEIPGYARVGAGREREVMRQGRALCRFWQGRLEIGIRLAILIIGALMFVLLVPLIAVGAELFTVNRFFAQDLITIAIVTLSSVLVTFQFFYTLVELGTFFTRICVQEPNLCTYCMLIWDIAHSLVLSGLYFLGFVSALTIGSLFPGVWSAPATSTATSAASTVITETTLGLLISVLCLLMVVLYIIRAVLVISFFCSNWDNLSKKYTRDEHA